VAAGTIHKQLYEHALSFNMDLKSLEEIAADTWVLIERARLRQLQPSEYSGATFSISNLGMRILIILQAIGII
jgi:pyruvate/2-oxoglutarate dehydrogenase complex dihydrolipoamide acyltransferase (E2) component